MGKIKAAVTKKRGKHTKKRKKIILISTEGRNRTEEIYFTNFNRIKDSEYHIIFACGNETEPIGVVNNAIASIRLQELDLENGDLAFCLVDCDALTQSRKNSILKAHKIANDHGIKLILSNPTFEVWYILHFIKSTKSYSSNKDVLDHLNTFIPNYNKSTNYYKEYLCDKTDIAIANANDLMKYHKRISNKTKVEECLPSTDVHKLVEVL